MARAVSFSESEKRRQAALLGDLFNDPGGVVISGKPRPYILQDGRRNIWPGVREDALAYFRGHSIKWWRHKEEREGPTGNLMSSQVACINHLFALRSRRDLAGAVLRRLDPDITEAALVVEPAAEPGYVAFEYIGQRPRLMESRFTRGEHCTSQDAYMIGVTRAGDRRAFLFEWKYQESEDHADKYKPGRATVYDHHIADTDSPFLPGPQRRLYQGPFYQMMRQTLLGWLWARHGDGDCGSWRNIQVAPAANDAFHYGFPQLYPGGRVRLADAWRSNLRQPERFIATTPLALMAPIVEAGMLPALTSYLQARYWVGDPLG